MNDAFFAAGPTDPLLNSRLTQMLAGLTTAFPLTTISSVSGADYHAGTEQIELLSGNSVCPPAAVWFFGASALVLVAGMQGSQQLTALLNGWQALPNPPTEQGINPAFEQGARSIYSSFITLLANRTNYYLAGYSYGGGVCCSLASLLFNRNPMPAIMPITYGQPRIGVANGALRMAQIGCTRWHLQADPVPALPPHRSECPWLAALLSRSDLISWSVQVQCPTGWAISVDGSYRQREDYGGPQAVTWLDVRNYVLGNQALSSPNHALSAYNAAFLAAVPNTPPVPPRPSPTQPEATETIRPRDYGGYVRIGEAVIDADATDPAGVTRNYAPPPVQLPSAPRYKAARDGKAWVIKLEDAIIAAATGKRSAKRLARSWNRAARAALSL